MNQSSHVENWRDAVGYENIYQVSSLGRVKRIAPASGARKGDILPGSKNPKGYILVRLSTGSRAKTFLAHRLVLIAFQGPPPPGHEANHKNGKKADNRPENLEWVTSSQNMLHSFRVLGRKPSGGRGGKGPRGEASGRAKLTTKQVKEIRRLHAAADMTQAELARRFSVSPRTVGDIVHRKHWTHI